MRQERSATWKGLWASISEGRAPRDAEVDDIAAKIWREVYHREPGVEWEEVEADSPSRRKSMAAALVALGAPPVRR